MEESLKKVFPDVGFEEEHVKERKRYLGMYENLVQESQRRFQEQMRLYAIKQEEYKQLEAWDRNLEALRAEKKTNRKRTPRTLKRLRTNPKPGTQSAGKKKIYKTPS
jgi:ATPase subunit of ABC transporter with duplicated ATPase domains